MRYCFLFWLFWGFFTSRKLIFWKWNDFHSILNQNGKFAPHVDTEIDLWGAPCKQHMHRNVYGSGPGPCHEVQHTHVCYPSLGTVWLLMSCFSLNLLSLSYFPAVWGCLAVPCPALPSLQTLLSELCSLLSQSLFCRIPFNPWAAETPEQQTNKPRNSPANSTALESKKCQSHQKVRALQPTGEGSELTASSSNKLLCQLSRKHRLQWHLEI